MTTDRLQDYLADVRANLRGLPDEDADEIVRELYSHVLDRIEGDDSEARIAEALARLGSAKDIARANLALHIAESGAGQRSPFALLHTLWRLAAVSLRGFVVLLISLIGYGFAASWLLTAVVKPFAPDRVGLWHVADLTDDFSYSLGLRFAPVAGEELLGWWITPLGLVLGLLFAWLTWRYSRTALRRIAARHQEALS